MHLKMSWSKLVEIYRAAVQIIGFLIVGINVISASIILITRAVFLKNFLDCNWSAIRSFTLFTKT